MGADVGWICRKIERDRRTPHPADPPRKGSGGQLMPDPFGINRRERRCRVTALTLDFGGSP